MKDLCGEIRYFYGVPVAFLQYPETVHFVRQQKRPQFLPVVEPESEMNVLGNVSHHGIGAASDAEMKRGISHHTEVLSLIDHDMVRLADYLCLLHSLVQVGQSRQIIDVEFLLRSPCPLPPVP